ncbi:MAG TPA: RHS repeat-associated core domain-containing protein, partial [Gemmataceae bacterium]|nr:RHS repeat-associated core domain-containing protein [Gemmataceae bacterium]
GNLVTMAHDVSSGSWTRPYAYTEPSRIAPGELGNRLSATGLPGDLAGGPYTAKYAYDAHGNMVSMPHLAAMAWDEFDRLRATARQVVNAGTPETTYYAYDAGGQRVRKTTDRQAPAGQAPARRAERVYLGPVEIYREFAGDGTTVTLRRETLHVSAGADRVALVETRTAGNDPAPAQLVRYQYANHLRSAALELDEQAKILSYEEYFPYGSTSYQAVRSQADTSKRYRYTGRERDEESALCYHGARYYAPWLGRWTAADPAGVADGPNLYAYARDNPTVLSDPGGTDSGAPSGVPKVAPSSAVFYGIDSEGHAVYGFGVGPTQAETPPQQPKKPDEPLEVVVRGKRPDRTPPPPPAPPAEEERSWWTRGVGTTVLGGVGIGIGIFLLASNPVGWVVGLTAALALASGVAGVGVGAVQLATSGSRTAKQDEEVNRSISTSLGFASSPGTMLGGTAGLLYTGTEEGLERGSLYGGLAEGAVSIGQGLGGAALREYKFSRLYQGTSYAWEGRGGVRSAIQEAYGLGSVAERGRINPLFPYNPYYRLNLEWVELSHSVPQRSIGGYEWLFNRPWNVTPMWATEHALADTFRWNMTTPAFQSAFAGQQLQGLPRALKLTPPWLLQTGYGAARTTETTLQH